MNRIVRRIGTIAVNEMKIYSLALVIFVSSAMFCSFGQVLEPQMGANNKWGFVDETGMLVIPYRIKLTIIFENNK